MANVTEQKRQSGKAIQRLILEAQEADMRERRTTDRHPFFRPIWVHREDRQYSAFSRDISEEGIGLQHNFDLPIGDLEITIASEKGFFVRVPTRIVWSRPCGEGWYLSGGQFIGAPTIG